MQSILAQTPQFDDKVLRVSPQMDRFEGYDDAHGHRIAEIADRLGAAVLCIDGRGTPGPPSWEKAVDRDFSVTLEDQIDGLHAAAERWP